MDDLIPFMKAHPVYFMDESHEQDQSPRFSANVGDDWMIDASFHWNYCVNPAIKVPRQGWKVHVSATPASAASTLSIVAETCTDLGVSFKYLPSAKRLHWRNSISCAREHAGKFITCYPTEEQLEPLLSRLEANLADAEGPYILSDRRWSRGPIYLRFGSFTPDAGEELSSAAFLNAPNGEREEDGRSASFSFPAWAPIPMVLQEWIQTSASSEEEDDDEPLPFTVSTAIQFSNSGGTYRGEAAGQPAIIKEARPFAGWDERRRDAVARLRDQEDVLLAASATAPVPRVLWSGFLWEHYFVAITQEPGSPLNQWVTDNYPGYVADPIRIPEYFQDASRVLSNLVEAITALHASGWAHMDLHPRNILVDADLNVALIDLECARRLDDPATVHDVAAPGFRAPGLNSPAAIDRYCLAQLSAYLLIPAVESSDLVHDYRDQIFEIASDRLVEHVEPSKRHAVRTAIDEYIASARRCAASLAPVMASPHIERRPFRRHIPPTTVSRSTLTEQLAAGTQSLDGVIPGRRYPVHPYGFDQYNGGLAFGDLAIGYAVHTQLSTAETAVPPASFGLGGAPTGLFTGEVGDLLVTDATWGPEVSEQALDMHLDRWLSTTGNRAYDGLPGVLVGLAHLFHERPELATQHRLRRVVDRARRCTSDYLADPTSLAPLDGARPMLGNRPADQNSGLLYGHLGMAWVGTLLHRLVPDRSWVDLTNRALHNELTGYVFDDRYGTLQLRQGYRQLPYLSMGSAGFGVILRNWAPETIFDGTAEKVPALLEATKGTISMFPGLFNGYAGLIVGRAGLERFLGSTTTFVDALDRSARQYVLESDSGLHIAGDAGVRLTTDVASGSAGLILAASALTRSDGAFLPVPHPSTLDGQSTPPAFQS